MFALTQYKDAYAYILNTYLTFAGLGYRTLAIFYQTIDTFSYLFSFEMINDK
jgi:hypothetical protein